LAASSSRFLTEVSLKERTCAPHGSSASTTLLSRCPGNRFAGRSCTSDGNRHGDPSSQNNWLGIRSGSPFRWNNLIKTWAWRLTFACEIKNISIARTFSLRVVSEAIAILGLPGQVIGEAARVSLVVQACTAVVNLEHLPRRSPVSTDWRTLA
jgi:hypothetical protein